MRWHRFVDQRLLAGVVQVMKWSIDELPVEGESRGKRNPRRNESRSAHDGQGLQRAQHHRVRTHLKFQYQVGQTLSPLWHCGKLRRPTSYRKLFVAFRRHMVLPTLAFTNFMAYLATINHVFLLALTLGAFAVASAQTPVASSGREFFLTLPTVDFGPRRAFRINITATNATTVTLYFTEYDKTETLSLSAGQRWERVIPADSVQLLEQEYLSNRSIVITSTEPVTVNAVNDSEALSEGYTALPTTSLGFDYIAMSYPGISFSSSQDNTRGGMVAVVATEDRTEVRITPSIATQAGHDAGFSYGVLLHRGEIYQITPQTQPRTDFTGTTISANKPVAVFAGHRGVPTDSNSAYNSLIEQMVPVPDWGQKFYVVKLHEQTRGRYRVLARSDGTQVLVDGRIVFALNAREVREITTDGVAIIEATQPVLVTQIGTHRVSPSQPPEVDSDPSMAIVNPVDSYAEQFRWSTPTMPDRPASGDVVMWRHWALITAPVAAATSVRLDAAPITFTFPHSDGAYTSALVEIVPGPHSVTASQPVNVQIYGDNNYDAYAMPAGMRLREPLRSPPVLTHTCNALLDTMITLSNFGGEQIEVTSTSFSSGSTSTRTLPTTQSFLVPPGGTRQVGIRVQLPRFGRVRDTLRIHTSTSGNRPLVIPIEIVRDSLAVEVLESSVTFAPTTTSNPTRDTVVHVVNTGTAPVRLLSSNVTGPFSIVSPSLPVTIDTGDTLAVQIRFAPAAQGVSSGLATLTLAPCGAPALIALSGRKLRPSAIDVPTVTIPDVGCGNDGADAPVVVRNTGEEPLRFDSVEVRGLGAPAFTVTSPPPGTLIAPGDSIVAVLHFAPPSAGTYVIALRIWNGASPGGYLLKSSIEARRVVVAATISRSVIDFGILGACDGDSSATLTMRNEGSAAMQIIGIATTSSAFTSSTASGFSIAPGEAATIDVRFHPTTGGVFADTLRITTTPCDTVIAVVLRGARSAASISSVVDTLDLGTIATCDLPAGGVAVIVNDGNVPITITSVVARGDGLSVIDVPDSTLDAGDRADVRVVFNGGPGSYSGTIIVTAEPCDLVHEIPFRVRIATAMLELTGPLDFGIVDIDTPVLRTAMLSNPGAAPVVIDAIDVTPSIAGLRIVSPAMPLTLDAGAQVPVVLEYVSSEPESFQSSLVVTSREPCDLSQSLQVISNQTRARTITLSLPDTVGWVDTRVTIPLSAHHVSEGAESLVLRFDVSWDRTMLSLERAGTSLQGASVSVLAEKSLGSQRVATLEFTGALAPDATLANLDMRVLVGASDRTSLLLTNATARSSDETEWSVSTRDGSFRTLGICAIGGGRFVRIAGSFALKGIAPNPAANRVTIALEGDAPARVTITLIDALGRRVAELFDDEVTGGRSEADVDVSGLPNGLYGIELRSGRHITRAPLMIAR